MELPVAQREAVHTLVDTVFFASLAIEEEEPVQVAIVHHEDGAAGLGRMLDARLDPEEEPAAQRRPVDGAW